MSLMETEKASDVADGDWACCRSARWRSVMLGRVGDSLPEPLSVPEAAAGSSYKEGSARCSPGKVSTCWVIKSSKEFYPKIGLSCEGEEDKLMVLFNELKESRE